MKKITLILKNIIFDDTEKITHRMNISLNDYINDALKYYNRIQNRRLLEDILKVESDLVKDDSLSVLKEFESFENNI